MTSDRHWIGPLMANVARAAEAFDRRWTMRALQRVDKDLAERFMAQRDDYDRALVTGSGAEAEEQAGGLIRGYAAITRRMEASGEADDAYLLGQAGNGLKVAIGHSKASIGRVQELHGERVVWMTPDEVAALMAGMGELAKVKALLPDAEIVNLYPAEAAVE